MYGLKLVPATLGGRLKAARDDKGYSQEYVAEKTGIPQNTISRLEIDAAKKPKRDHLEKLALLYNISLDSLLTNPYTIDHIPWEIRLMLYDKEALPYIAEAFVKYQQNKFRNFNISGEN